jgi:hypothetical protein
VSDFIELGRLQDRPLPGLVLNPGDRVLVGLGYPLALSRAEVDDLRGRMEARFPGVAFTFVTQVQQMAVMRAEPAEEMPTGEDFMRTFATPDLDSTEHQGRRGLLRWQRDKARRELAAAEHRIEVLEQELNEQGAHFDATRQEYRREIEELQEKNMALQAHALNVREQLDQVTVDKEAAETTEDRLRTENKDLWRRLDEAARQLQDMLGRRIVLDNPSREDHRKVTRERALARMQRDRLILAIRTHLNGNCGRNTRHLHDVVDEVEREIASTRDGRT